MSIVRGIAALGAVLLVAGCVTVSTPIKATFDPVEAGFINKQGKGVVTGQAFLRRNDGIVVYAAGSEVALIPKTKYSTERIGLIFKDQKINYFRSLTPPPPEYEAYMRKTKADGEGRFTFEGVSDGDYYIMTTVVWYVQYQQGGQLLEPISVSGGNTVNVIMTGE